MAPPISQARAALRAVHRMNSLATGSRRNTVDQQDEEAQGSPGPPDLTAPLLPNATSVLEQRAAENRTAAREAKHTSSAPDAGTADSTRRATAVFQDGVRDIMHARRQLRRTNSGLSNMSTGTQRDKVFGMFDATTWGLPGTGLMNAAKNAAEDALAPPEERPGIISPKSDAAAITRLVLSSWLNVLLLCAPLGILAAKLNWGPIAVFCLNFGALVPLALILGEITEDLALRFGQTIGGLLNATFGNVVEMILSIAALLKGLYSVVAASLIGSILSNLLLVLGCCFLFGGVKYRVQEFNATLNKACCSLLLLACIGIIIPSSAQQLFGPDRMPDEALANISHAIAICLGLVYICYLYWQLKTHKDMFTGEEGGDEEHPVLSIVAAFGALAVITIIVAVCSEYLTGAIEQVSASSGLNQIFLGLIVLPIAGNACEHITAVFVAMKDKMDLAIGVALGSSIQIAIFVIPFVCLVGWATGHHFYLNFEPFAVLVLTLSVVHAYFVSSDGQSHWLLGVLLVATYVLVALLYLFIKGDDPE